MPATYKIQVDWNQDGDFADTGEDVTSRTLARSDLTIQYGRDQSRALSPIAPGRAAFELDNRSRDYSPENTSSPLAGNILPARPVLIEATLSGNTYTLFRGHVDDFDVLPGVDERSVAVTCLDGPAKLIGAKISTPLYTSIRTGEAIGRILDSMPWSRADLRDLDEGASYIRWWWEDGTDAWDALNKVVATEGPPAFVFLGADDSFVFRDRHHRITDAASLTSQATFAGAGEPMFSAPLVYDHGWRDIINMIDFSVDERSPSSPFVEEVWSTDDIRSIASGQTIEWNAVASDPFIKAATPVEGLDYTLRSGTVTVWLARNSGQSTTIYAMATGGPARIDGMRLRAIPVTVRRQVRVTERDSVSINRYGPQSYSETPAWLNVNDARAVAQVILGQRAERLPIVSMRLINGSDTRLTQQLARNLSDRVHITETDQLGLNTDFFIERIEHSVSEAGLTHDTVFGCEKAADQVTGAFTFDKAGAGFNDGVFARRGYDNPANVFRFDVANHGFDDGLFAF